ncbi:MAG: outer membrane beta-barrel protein [Chitinophagaceae bacterium]
MRLFFVAILATLAIFVPSVSAAQHQLHITGSIYNQKNEPAVGATIVLKPFITGQASLTAMADSSGQFSFNQVNKGSYSLLITLTGFTPYQIDTIQTTEAGNDLGQLILQPEVGLLNDVVVNSRKPLVTRKNDRTIVNVDAMISAAGSTALDVLEKSPGVQVDQNGAISLKGKGVMVFIDDKPTYLSGDDLANYLKSLPASSLEQVELMTNPPARYDAAGTGGVINIRTKKIRQKGWNGGVNLGLTQGQLTRSNSSANINLRRNKFTVFANIANSYNNSFTDLDLFRTYKKPDGSPGAFFEQNSYFDREGNTASFRTGADFYQNERSTWGIMVNGMTRKSTQINDNTSNLLGSSRQVDSVIVALNDDRIRFRNIGTNFNFRHQFNKSGHGITADVDFIRYRNHTRQDYRNYIYNPDGSPRYDDRLDGDLPNNIDIYTVKTDYTRPLSKGFRFESGLKNSYTETNNTAGYNITTGGVTKPDYEKSNQFIYKETILAGYTNLSYEGSKLSLQAGLRAEHTNSDGNQLGNALKPDSSFLRKYTSLFPTFYVTWKLDTSSVNQIGLNYGRRIDRPYYQDLNPFFYPMDKFTYYSGNPFLKPAFTNSLELSHTWKNRITTTFSYSQTTDNVSETIEISEGIYYSRPGNIGRSITKTIAVDGTFDPFKWLNIHVYTEFGNIHSKSAFYTGTLNTSGNYWYIGPMARITMKKGWTGELSGNYRTNVTSAQFILKTIWGANLAIQKKFSAKMNMKLAVNDLFYSRINRGIINNLASAEASWTNKNDSRNATLTFSYNFGEAFAQKKHESSGADSEKNRVRN